MVRFSRLVSISDVPQPNREHPVPAPPPTGAQLHWQCRGYAQPPRRAAAARRSSGAGPAP
eukprot:1087531-Prymnesium_polylepis.1